MTDLISRYLICVALGLILSYGFKKRKTLSKENPKCKKKPRKIKPYQISNTQLLCKKHHQEQKMTKLYLVT